MIKGVIPQTLYKASRPGWPTKYPVPEIEVERWVREAKQLKAKSILCLLDETQLAFYRDVPTGLIGYYRAAGFEVAQVPAADHQDPPLSDEQLEDAWRAFQSLPRPVIIHCSAGCDRTGMAVDHLLQRLGHG